MVSNLLVLEQLETNSNNIILGEYFSGRQIDYGYISDDERFNELIQINNATRPISFYHTGKQYLIIGGYAGVIQFSIDYYNGSTQYRTYGHSQRDFT